MKLDRRAFLKANAVAAAASVSGIPVKALAADAPKESDIKWDKAACRFFGTGCSVFVGTRKGGVVATQSDP